jgi:hypothetical protein
VRIKRSTSTLRHAFESQPVVVAIVREVDAVPVTRPSFEPRPIDVYAHLIGDSV